MSEASHRASDGGTEKEMAVGETETGDPYTLPVEDVLTGRGFLTGKSGAGKSNTASVIAEELLERGHPLLIVDADGEYWGLKEQYEILHAGADGECDLQVGPEHAERLAELALEQHVPIVLDVSGYVDRDEADELVFEVTRQLFAKEKDIRRPFLVLVEEIHEYIPQQGSGGDVEDMLVRIAKRGRKRGLGIFGASQRPSSVDKDFITQSDLLVWHRLTWDSDVKRVRKVVGGSAADEISELDPGEAFVQADWSDAEVERVQFRRKETFDAGATPGLDDVERPELQSIDEDLVGELQEISQRQERKQDRIEQLEATLEDKEAVIEEKEAEIERLRTADETLDLLTSRLQGTESEGEETPVDFQQRLEEKNETIADLRDEVGAIEDERDKLQERVDDLEAEVDRLQAIEERVEQAERYEEQIDRVRDIVDVEADGEASEGVSSERLREAQQRIDDLEAEKQRLESQVDAEVSETLENYEDFLSLDVVEQEKEAAKEEKSTPAVKGILASIIQEGGPVKYATITERIGHARPNHVSAAATELENRKIIEKDKRDDDTYVDLNTDGIAEIRQAATEREKTKELMEEL